MLNKRHAILLSLVALLVATPGWVWGYCNVSVNCNNYCELDYTCPSPYPPCEIFCSANAQTRSCTGTNCSADTNSVTCDGVKTSCPTSSQCFQSTYTIYCGSTTVHCPNICQL